VAGLLPQALDQAPAWIPDACWVKMRFLGLALSLTAPSLGIVEKYFGQTGALFYLLLAVSMLSPIHTRLVPYLAARFSIRQTRWFVVVTFIALALLFFAVYPLANSGLLGGGSDRDEALNQATRAVLSGHYPYSEKTYLGNLISPLPGAIFLAMPFVLLGNSAYQNLFWFFVFVVLMAYYLKSHQRALLLLWTFLTLSPVVLQEFVTGGDLLANSIYVLVFSLSLAIVTPLPGFPMWGKVSLAILLGLGFASRANFLLVLPLLYSALARRVGWKTAILLSGVACLVSGIVTIPFFLYRPAEFSPLHTIEKLRQFDRLFPNAWLWITLSAGAIAVALSFRDSNTRLANLLQHCALVLAFPVLCGAVMQSLSVGHLDFIFTGFGLTFLFFGAAGYYKEGDVGIDFEIATS